MTIAKRKERQKEELRGKILEAAKALFIERGFEDTSIRNIAEKIEYSPTTIYLYFKDKDDIFYALHQEGFVLLNQYLRALQNVAEPFERLKTICKAYIAFALENREFYDLMFISRSPMNALAKDDEKLVHGICSLEIRGRCTVIREANQENLPCKAGTIIIEILERMHQDSTQ
jgi:AcrR family transcriptional regulator